MLRFVVLVAADLRCLLGFPDPDFLSFDLALRTLAESSAQTGFPGSHRLDSRLVLILALLRAVQ